MMAYYKKYNETGYDRRVFVTQASADETTPTFGWSRTITSGAVTLNLVIYGPTAPSAAASFAGWIRESQGDYLLACLSSGGV